MLQEPMMEKLMAMRLLGMVDALKAQEQDPASRELGFLERLGMLVDQHWTWRENQALARRLHAASVTANALHPGFVATRFGNDSGGIVRAVLKVAKPIGAISPEEGAQTIIYLASAPEVAGVSGQYFYECRPATPTRFSCPRRSRGPR